MQFRLTQLTQLVILNLVLLILTLFTAGIISTNAQAAQKADQKNDKTAQQIETGKKIFDEVNCLLCHLLNGEGGDGKGHPLNDSKDLAGVGVRRDQASLRKWLQTHLFEEPRIDMFEEDPTDADIEALVQYLSTLKTPPSAEAVQRATTK
ncbi:MAG: cytochrome c [bacterium]